MPFLSPQLTVQIASLLMALGIGAGAFGAHALKSSLDPYMMSVYEKAVFYHLVHAVALLALSACCAAGIIRAESLQRVGVIMLAGIVIFSGSLYVLVLTNVRWLGAITPIGGTALIIAWMLLAYESSKNIKL
jgi:uncharacterized membrane protein YgdD (TMEM256/DUF423 family)